MRLVVPALACAAATLCAAGCGGDDEGVRTVIQVRTVTQGATGTTAAPGAGPTGSTASAGATGATESAPGAGPLPQDTGGATAVQGTYRMRVTETEIGGPSKGVELAWSALTRCEQDECEVQLKRENENGGFKDLQLEAQGPSRYAADSTGETDYCVTEGTRPTRDRTSVSVQQQRDEGGVPLATEIEGFVRVTFKCSAKRPQTKIVYRLRGRLEG